MKYIRIKYWPVERIYPDPNKLQASKPDTWKRMSAQAREAWAKNYLRHMMGPKAVYVGWVNSDG